MKENWGAQLKYSGNSFSFKEREEWRREGIIYPRAEYGINELFSTGPKT